MGLTLLFARKKEGTVEIRFSARRQGLRAPERQTSEAQVNQAICALITHLHHGRFSATDSCEEVVFTMRIPSAERYREGARGPGLNFDQEDIAPLDPEAIRKEENDLKGRKVNSHD